MSSKLDKTANDFTKRLDGYIARIRENIAIGRRATATGTPNAMATALRYSVEEARELVAFIEGAR